MLPKFNRKSYIKIRDILQMSNTNSVCVEANCPNRYECFSKKTATFLILGNICTRNCLYCNISHGFPKDIPNEATTIASLVNKLNLKYVVITSVTRDDLIDGGASVFTDCINKIKSQNQNIKIEILIPDFKGNWNILKNICNAKPYVINHNIETTKNIFNIVRPQGNYKLSLELLKKVKQINPDQITKSGIMLGLGESLQDIINSLKDLRNVSCDGITIGQYLSPSKEHYPVKKIYTDKEFLELEKIAIDLGFTFIKSGKLVRSSYMASDIKNTKDVISNA